MRHTPQGRRVKEKEGERETGGQKGKVREQGIKDGKKRKTLLEVQAKRKGH